MTDRVGLVGLGFIGASIGERLLVTGDPPVVLDLVAERVDALAAQGAVRAASVPELAERCDVVLVCVQTDEQCLDLVTGPTGLLDHLSPGALVAVLSTISPHSSRTLTPRYGVPLWRSGSDGSRARAWSALHGFIHVRKPFSRSATMRSVTRA